VIRLSRVRQNIWVVIENDNGTLSRVDNGDVADMAAFQRFVKASGVDDVRHIPLRPIGCPLTIQRVQHTKLVEG
jgi:hypothetical protein